MAQLGYVNHTEQCKTTTPYDSKIGGAPVWFCNTPPLDSNVCVACLDPLFMVAQIYAPVEFARSLAIFGCNKQQCSKLPSTWRVVRTQNKTDSNPWKLAAATQSSSKIEISGKQKEQVAAAVGQEEEVPTQTTPTEDDGWGGGGGWGGVEEGAGDVFNSFGGIEIEEAQTKTTPEPDLEPNLETLLRARDQSLQEDQQKEQQQPKKNKKKKKKKKKSISTIEKSLDKATIDIPKAPTTSTGTDTGTPVLLAPPPSINTASFTEKYLYVEAEPSEGSQKVTKNSIERSVEKHLKQHISNSSGSGGGGGLKAEYEETPKAEKALIQYQQRIGRSPTQCLRYAYDTVPLWPSPLDDLEEKVAKVPRCVCGAKRVFELQLLSTVLHELDVDSNCQGNEGKSKGKSKGKSGGGAEQRRRMIMNHGGMDWSTLLVYSCADSCDQSYEEVVVVHQPL